MTSLDEPPTAVITDVSEPTASSAPKTATTESEAPATESEVRYMGLITRGIAFVIDAALISLVAFLAGAAVALIGSIFHVPHHTQNIVAVIGGAAYVLWAAGYFVGFWSATGQTPGDRIMQIRVVTAGLGPVKPIRGIVRCVGLVLATVPLFLGFVPIPFDKRRRGLADWLARTVVVDAPSMSVAETTHVKKGSLKDASRTARA
ncbi:MAG: RDD family protein [Solirubrobacteraceae bacterium]